MKKPSAKGFAVSAVSLGLVLVGGCAFWGPGGAPPKPANTAATNAVPDAAPGEADYRQGRSYQGSMQYAAAITAYRKALQENPGNAEAHNALGVAYASLGRHDEAVAELMTALALAPKAAHIYNNLGYAYLLHGSKAEALAILRLANTLEPADKRFLENMRAAEQSLTLDRALRAACIDPAVSARELDRGRLTVGQRADVVVIPAAAIDEPVTAGGPLSATRPAMVLIDGEVVFEL